MTFVHIIPHSHDDMGWLKTVDQYYNGARNDIQVENVQLILDNSIRELLRNPERTFTEVEMGFFSMWWADQTEEMKEKVRGLVKSGQLEFVNGGWSMNDEACTHYTEIINNMKAGHDFLKREFDVTPNIGWHLDPFGHSEANQALFAEMGMDAFIVGRIDFEDKKERLERKEMEFIWQPFLEDRGDELSIFTHVMFDHYYPPEGFMWCTNTCPKYDEPIVDDKNLKTYNADKRAAEFRDIVTHMREHYRSNHLLVSMGGDFFYKNAHKLYKNIDKLISSFNNIYSDF